MQVDLKFSPEEAAKEIGRQVDRSIENLRHLGEELVQKLRDAASFNAADVVALTEAERALVVDFENGGSFNSGPNPIKSIGLQFDNGWGHRPVELASPLPPGSYRAVILISRRKK